MADDIVASVADDLPVGVWVARAPGGEFLYANKAFAEIMGMGPLDDVGRGEYSQPYGVHTRTGELYPEDRLPFVRALVERRKVVVDDIVIHRRDGRKVHVRAEARPVFGADGEISHVVIGFVDISREALAEAARADTEQRMRQMQRMDSIGTLAGGIAHDFNNLLATVKLLAAVLRRDETDTEKLACIDQIDQVTDSAAQLTRGLLGFARRGKHLSTRVSLHDVIFGVVTLMRRALDRRMTIDTELRAATGEVVGDLSQMEQVLMNLLVNARDALMDGGGVRDTPRDWVLEEADLVKYPTLRAGPHVVLEVADEGPGVDASIRDRIFEPYFTTKKTVERGVAEGSAGLGLATVWGIIESHHAAIEVCAAQPRGATFRIVWPAAAEADERASSSDRPRGVVKGQGTVLVVDDERAVRDAAVMSLRGLGYRVFSADSGSAAIEVFRARAKEIDAVLLDMIMPQMDGRHTYLELQRLRPDVCVVLTTGFALNEEAQSILDLGVSHFIAKPYSLEALSQVVAKAVARSA